MERQQLLCDGRDWKLSFTLVDATDHATRETTITYDQVTVKYWTPGATSKTSYTVTTADWKHAGDGDYSLNIGAQEFTQTYHDYCVSVAATGCDTVTLAVTSWPRLAVSYTGADLALATQVNALTASLKKGDMTIVTGEGHPAPTTTSAIFLQGSLLFDVGDVLVWPASVAPTATVVQSVQQFSPGHWSVTWLPALNSPTAVTPQLFWNPLLATMQHLPIQAGAAGGSVNERIKAMGEKLPTGTISDYDEHRGRANVGYDGSTLTVNAWLEHRGETVGEPTSCTVTVYDDAGEEAFALSEDTPDAQGVFKVTKESPGLAAGKSYYARVEIEANETVYTTVEGISTL